VKIKTFNRIVYSRLAEGLTSIFGIKERKYRGLYKSPTIIMCIIYNNGYITVPKRFPTTAGVIISQLLPNMSDNDNPPNTSKRLSGIAPLFIDFDFQSPDTNSPWSFLSLQ
jgi:hypothetical protein